MRRSLLASMAALMLAIAGDAVSAAAAAQPRREPGPRYVYVTAESRYGGASITAPVRSGPQGRLEVRLPGGTWLECGRSCSDTLRRETVDFWRNHGPGRGLGSGDGPGYIQFRW